VTGHPDIAYLWLDLKGSNSPPKHRWRHQHQRSSHSLMKSRSVQKILR
jgi:hypothetical protein